MTTPPPTVTGPDGTTYTLDTCPVCQTLIALDPDTGTFLHHHPRRESPTDPNGLPRGHCLGVGLHPGDPDPRT